MMSATNRSGLAGAANAYAQGGLHVFPLHSITLAGACTCGETDCQSPGKHPRTPHGVKDASDDPDVIEGWWSRWPDANIGVATGPGLIYVIDIDGDRGAESWRQLSSQYGGEVATRGVTTGNGRHLWYVTDLELGNTSSKLAPGVDTRGRGGYVVAPPSVHAAGGGTLYSWENPGAPLAPLPQWVADLLQRPERPATPHSVAPTPGRDPIAQKRLQGLAGHLALMAPDTGRNNALNHAAYTCGRLVAAGRLDRDHAEHVLATAAQRCGLGARETEGTIRSGLDSGADDPDYEGLTPQWQAPTATTIEQEVEKTAADAPWIEDIRERARSGRDFLSATRGPIPAVWGEQGSDAVLWAEGEGLLVAGPPGTGKTTLVQQAVAGLIGHPDHGKVLGHPIHGPRNVLYLALDRPRQIGRALGRLLEPDEPSVGRLTVWDQPLPFDAAVHHSALTEICRALDCDVVVVDSLYDLSPSIVKPEIAGEVVRTLKQCVNDGIDLVAIHHGRKQPTQGRNKPSLDELYGGMQLGAGFGSVLWLKGTAGDPTVDLLHLKQPGEVVGPLEVTHDHQTGTSDVADNVDLVALAATRGSIRVLDAAQVITGEDEPDRASKQRVQRTLDGLVKRGLLNKNDHGRGRAIQYVPAVSVVEGY